MMITVYFTLKDLDNLESGITVPGLPLLYRGRILGLIKRALEAGSEEYKRELYTGHVPKHFSFSVYPMGGHTTEKVKVRIKPVLEVETYAIKSKTGVYRLMISTADPFFAVILESGLINMKRHKTVFPFSVDNYMTVDGVKLGIEIDKITMTERKEIGEHVRFKTLSPLFLNDKNRQPVLYSDTRFEEVLNEVSQYKMERFFNRKLLKPLQIEQLTMKQKAVQIVEVKESKPVLKLLCSDGFITLKGHKDDLNLLYRMGLGMKTGYGFGMVEVA